MIAKVKALLCQRTSAFLPLGRLTFLLSLIDEIVTLFQRLDFPRNGFGDVFTFDDAQPIPNMGFEPGVVELQRSVTR